VNQLSNSSMNRRQLLRNGGLVLSLGAIIAACGEDRDGSDAPGRLGVADPAPELPGGDVDDVLLLRTAQSIEYTLIAAYALIADSLSSEAKTVVDRLVDDHTRHAEVIGELVSAAGGEPFDCANPFMAARVLPVVADALAGTDDAQRDAHNIAHGFEVWAARSCQAFVPMFVDPELRSEIMRVGNEDNRHAAAMALVINPDEPVNPVLYGHDEDTANLGFVIPYAVPATFGQLGPYVLVIGELDEEGARTPVALQTPAENMFVYPSMSCQ